jgi:hypothetical protein
VGTLFLFSVLVMQLNVVIVHYKYALSDTVLCYQCELHCLAGTLELSGDKGLDFTAGFIGHRISPMNCYGRDHCVCCSSL